MEHHANVFLTNLAIVLCVAAVTTVVFQRLRQPVVLGYILAGLLVGPHVPFPLVADDEIIRGLSELGVILLLFTIGLEFTVEKLLRVGAAAAIVAAVEVSIQIILGDLAGRIFGWSPRESLFAGAVVAISSTTIIAKAFAELRIGGRLRELVLSILIVEDLIAILLLAALTTLSAGRLSAAELGITAGRLALFLGCVVVAGLLIIPRLVRAILKLDRPETTAVASVGICFAFALLAQRFGYSVALGAFLAGTLVAESQHGVSIEHLLQPVRDLFAAVFFVSVGMLIDPRLVRQHWAAILVLSAVVIAGKTVGVSIPAFLTGAGIRTSVAASMSLAQIGEFSFIIAAVGTSTRIVPDFFYPVAVSVSALTTLTTPWMIRASGPVAAWVDRKLPHALQTFVALYASWIDGLRAPGPRRTRAQRLVRLLLLDAALLTAAVVLCARFFPDVVDWLRARGLGARAAEMIALATAIALTTPFLAGSVRLVGALALSLATQALPAGAPGKVDLAAAPRRALVVALQLAAAVALGLPLFAVARAFLPLAPTLALFAAAFVFLGIRLWLSVTQLQGHVRAGAQVLAAAFSQARGTPAAGSGAVEAEIGRVLPGLGSPVRFTLSQGSPAVGRTLASLNLRGATGATVLAIARAGEEVLVPTGHEVLRVDDVLALAGTGEAVEAARALLSGRGAVEQAAN
ncbi:MAG: potassium transporter [Deltaproteobacteria bacterium 13_1_40CM_68_24]|nr:MAG: potassium transporter [Deltaproteobacteria bacterium 13_1_40CM_68_24]OLC77835.1 MAG: potassium transporter [Deltaproteobacteria bacterium 13_1_40CM_4_68_19]OLD09793.1 MAG: potassium transporter [Deltaproteobacteria bacterium 13_1_40CM_3_69_14]HMC32847.1 cation:proton antiporter [Myxococcales bacterium]